MKDLIKVVPSVKLKWKGVFNMDELYKNMKYWLDYQGYGDHETNFKENRYVERIKGGEKQLEIQWTAQKNWGEYFAYQIKVGFFVLGLKEIEIESEGKKIKSNHAEIELRFSSNLIVDRQDRWKSSFMQYLYEKFIVKQRLEDHKIDLYKKTYSFHDEIKAYLTMHQY